MIAVSQTARGGKRDALLLLARPGVAELPEAIGYRRLAREPLIATG
jgi:hypothetical protein